MQRCRLVSWRLHHGEEYPLQSPDRLTQGRRGDGGKEGRWREGGGKEGGRRGREVGVGREEEREVGVGEGGRVKSNRFYSKYC